MKNEITKRNEKEIAQQIVNQISQAPKATHAQALNTLMNAIKITAQNPDSVDSRLAALGAIATIENSDSKDVIQRVSESVRQQLELEAQEQAMAQIQENN